MLIMFLESAEMLPASRILEIVGASPLSDDDIQQLIEQLLEKRNTNAEWQEVSGRTGAILKPVVCTPTSAGLNNQFQLGMR